MFREDRLTTYQSLTESANGLISQRQELERENEQLTAAVNDARLQQREVQPQIEALKNEIGANADAIAEKNQQQIAMRDSIHATKEKVSELNATAAAGKLALLERQQECADLSAQVIEDPEGLKSSLKDMESDATTLKSEIADKAAAATSLTQREKALEYVQRKLVKRTEQVAECIEEVGKASGHQREVKEVLRKIGAAEDAIGAHGETQAMLKAKVDAAQDKLCRLQAQFEQKRHAAVAALERVQSERDELTRAAGRDKTLAGSHQQAAQVKQQQLLQMRSEHDTVVAKLKYKIEVLMAQVMDYHHALRLQMKKSRSHTGSTPSSKQHRDILANITTMRANTVAAAAQSKDMAKAFKTTFGSAAGNKLATFTAE
jgi:chromosome segregation ATPase